MRLKIGRINRNCDERVRDGSRAERKINQIAQTTPDSFLFAYSSVKSQFCRLKTCIFPPIFRTGSIKSLVSGALRLRMSCLGRIKDMVTLSKGFPESLDDSWQVLIVDSVHNVAENFLRNPRNPPGTRGRYANVTFKP